MKIRTSGRWLLFLAFMIPMIIFVLSARSYVGYWDVGEMDTVPWMLGIGHPTGFPAYVLAGWLFAHLVPLGSVALRMSLFSACAIAATAWLIAEIIHQERASPAIAVGSALIFALGESVWTYATRAEVHAFAIFMVALTIYLALSWYRSGGARAFLGACAALGVGIGAHPVAGMILPGLIVLLLARIRTTSPRIFLSGTALFFTVFAGFYAYLPLRSAYVNAHRLEPTLALGLPPGRPFWNTDNPATFAGFMQLVGSGESNPGQGLAAVVSPRMYVEGAGTILTTIATELTGFGAMLALLGLVIGLWEQPVKSAALLLCGLPGTLFVLGYASESDKTRYYLALLVVCAIFTGEAAGWFAERLGRGRYLAACALFLCAAFLLWSGRGLFAQPRDDGAAVESARVLAETPDDAILVANWLYAAPLAYQAYVEDRMGRRILDTAFIANDEPYLGRWLATHPVYVVGDPQPLQSYDYRQIEAHPPIYEIVPNGGMENR